jgi:hypothetical protein
MARRFQQSEGAALPPLNIPAATRFASEWARLPAHARVLHAMAHKAGLMVTHTADKILPEGFAGDRDGFLWIGEGRAFKASGLFKASTDWHFYGWGATQTGEGLNVELFRFPDHDGGSVVAAFHKSYPPPDSRGLGRFCAMAQADAAYQSFRAATLKQLDAGALVEPDEEDEGPLIQVWINEQVRDDYLARGVFLDVAAHEPGRWSYVNVPVSTVRAMVADAEAQARKDRSRKAAAKWWALAGRLRREICRIEGAA